MQGMDDKRLFYLPGLDGLRALAVLGVLLFHAGQRWIPGGFLGVEVFFVISGYLITCVLLESRERSGSVGLKQFWFRRARRLLPALFALLLGTLAVSVIFYPDEVAKLRGDTIAALGYVTNWYFILDHQSYFDEVGRPSLLRHLWSLAIEEQFYLVWPVVLALLVRRLRAGVRLGAVEAQAVSSAGFFGRAQLRRPRCPGGADLSSRRARPISRFPLPRRICAGVRQYGGRHRGCGASQCPPRETTGAAAAAMVGHAFLRGLSLALARLHAHPAGARCLHRWLGAARAAAGHYPFARGDFLPAGREAGEIRGAGTGVADLPRRTRRPALVKRRALGSA